MKVTNEQAKAHVICFESMDKCPEGCPFVGSPDCSEDKAFEVDIAKALLESRAQNAELLAALKEEIEFVCTDCLKHPSSMCNTCEGMCGRTKAMQAAIAKMEVGK